MQSRPLPVPEEGPTETGASGWVDAATPYRPLDWPARVVQALLAVYLQVSIAAVAFDWLELDLWTRLLHDPASLLEAHPTPTNSRQMLLDSLQSGAYLLTGIGFLVWFHRAYTNLRAFGIEQLPYTTGWAVGAWLVPFLNLVRPKRMTDIIWRGSDPAQTSTISGDTWRSGPVHALVHWWWAVFVGKWLVDRVLAFLLHQGFRSEEALRVLSVRTLVADGLGVVLGVLCLEVVRRTTRRQQARAAQPAVAPPG